MLEFLFAGERKSTRRPEEPLSGNRIPPNHPSAGISRECLSASVLKQQDSKACSCIFLARDRKLYYILHRYSCLISCISGVSFWFPCPVSRRADNDGLSMHHSLLSTKMMSCHGSLLYFHPFSPAACGSTRDTGREGSTEGSSILRPITPSEGLSCWFTFALRELGTPHFSLFFVYENWWNIRMNYKNNKSNPFLQHFHLHACQGRGTINHRSITREHLLLIGTRFYSAIASPAWQSRYLVKPIRPRYPARPKKCQGSHWDSTCLNSRISPVH